MKKLLCLATVLLLTLTVFVACGDADTTAKPDTTTTPAVTTTADGGDTTTADGGDTTTAAKPDDTTAAKPTDTTAEKPDDTTAAKPTDTTAEKPTDEPVIDENSIDIYENGDLRSFAIEDHHDHLDNHPAFVFLMGNTTIFKDLIGTGYNVDAFSNPKYQWVLTVNGEKLIPAKMSIYDGGDWGYFRCDLGAMENYNYQNEKFSYAIDLVIVEVATGKVAYYAEFTKNIGPFVHNLGMIADESRPSTVTKVEGVTCVSGPDKGGYEGADKAFDGDIKTKICTDDNSTPIVANLGAKKTLKGISLVNANDNSGSNGRTVLNFEVWVSEDGQNWGSAAAWSTDGAGLNKSELSDDFMERYYSFDKDISASYVKIVVNNGEMYQMSEIIFYE